MSCPCEGCKAARARRYAKAVARREAQAAKELELNLLRDRADRISGRIEASRDATWMTGRDESIRVQSMHGAHLFYAIAKGLRGEYHGGRSLEHLKNEALRRLILGVV